MKPIKKDVVAGAPARFRGASQLDPRVLAADPAVVPESVKKGIEALVLQDRARQQKRIEALAVQASDMKKASSRDNLATAMASTLEHFRANDMKKRLPADADMMTVRLPEGLLERTKIRAIKEKATLQSLVAAALENYLLAAESGKGK